MAKSIKSKAKPKAARKPVEAGVRKPLVETKLEKPVERRPVDRHRDYM